MNCFLATGAPCSLLQSKRPDLFEVHLTISPCRPDELQDFFALCTQLRWKAIVIDLAPHVPQQPMTCSRVAGSLSDVYTHAEFGCTQLETAGFSVTRVKIEAAPWNSHVPQDDHERLQHHPTAYFEYHAKLHLPLTGWEATLSTICPMFTAHLSHNALRVTDNGWTERFATIRSHDCGLASFQLHTDRFGHTLQSHGFSVLKTVTEYCIYDTNTALDANCYPSPLGHVR